MARPLTVTLAPEARERLLELAARERRSPRQQAAIMLERALAAASEKRSPVAETPR